MATPEDLLARIEALEAEVRSLRSGSASGGAAGPVTRRRLLHGAALAVAGAAGTVASPVLTGRAAAGTVNGESVDLGEVNNATSITEIQSNVVGGPTLELENTGTGTPLRLSENRPGGPSVVDEGDLFPLDGFLYYGWASDAASPVYESSWVNHFFPLTPFRILDTAGGTPTDSDLKRALVSNPSGKFDSAGRLISGQTIDIDLSDFTDFATAIAGNFATLGSSQAGYITVWNTGEPRPFASLINFDAGQTIANWALTPIGKDGSDRDSISIYASRSTRVVLDLMGLFISDYSNLGPIFGVSAAAGANAAAPAGAAQRAPRKSRPAIR